MYVAGNPVTYSDPTGHFSFKKWAKKVAGTIGEAVVQGTTGHSTNWWGDKISDAGKWCGKQWDKVENTVGSGDWWKKQWNDHQWLRITTYILAITAVTLLAYFAFPVFVVMGGYTVNTTALGLMIGSGIGFILGGTHGLDNQWDWEGAFKGMLIGGIIGATIGYMMGVSATSGTYAGYGQSPPPDTITYGEAGNITGFTWGSGINELSLSSISYNGMSPAINYIGGSLLLGIAYMWN